MKPRDFEGTNLEYLQLLVNEVFPIIKSENLAKRIDIFTEKSAFSIEESRAYLQKAKENGFEITVHADQFTPGASVMAVEFGAMSADHLEFSDENDIRALSAAIRWQPRFRCIHRIGHAVCACQKTARFGRLSCDCIRLESGFSANGRSAHPGFDFGNF